QHHRWPGNVRELRNVIQRAVLLSGEGPIGLEHLPPLDEESSSEEAALKGETVSLEKTQRFTALTDEKRHEVEALEQKRIQAALEECAGNQTRAAKLLGIS